MPTPNASRTVTTGSTIGVEAEQHPHRRVDLHERAGRMESNDRVRLELRRGGPLEEAVPRISRVARL